MDSKLTLIATQGSNKYFADYKQWTGFIVSQLESELKTRGARCTLREGQSLRLLLKAWGFSEGLMPLAVLFVSGRRRQMGHGPIPMRETMPRAISIGRLMARPTKRLLQS